MEMKTILTNAAKIGFPVFLGGIILYWMYRGEDFGRFYEVMTKEMDWTWMLLSFPLAFWRRCSVAGDGSRRWIPS